MSKPTDDELDAIFEKHFSEQLDGQLGRATTAFDQHHAMQKRTFWLWRIVPATGIAAVAAIVLVAVLRAPSFNDPRQNSVPPPVVVKTDVAKDSDLLEQTVWVRTLDQGTVFLDDQTPARKLIRQEVQEVDWVDSTGKSQITTSIPHEDIVLVSLSKY